MVWPGIPLSRLFAPDEVRPTEVRPTEPAAEVGGARAPAAAPADAAPDPTPARRRADARTRADARAGARAGEAHLRRHLTRGEPTDLGATGAAAAGLGVALAAPGALTPGTLTPGALTPGALTPGALTPGAPTAPAPEATLAQRVPPRPLPLEVGPAHGVRLPNYADARAGDLRSAFPRAGSAGNPIIPLTATGLVDPHTRVGGPTTVRAIFDKVEMYNPGSVAPGTLTRLATPERLTLVPGDRVALSVWGDNRSGAGVTHGLQLRDPSGRLLDPRAVLEDIRVAPAAPDRGPAVPLEQALRDEGVMGRALRAGQYGGFVLTGRVRADVAAGTQVDVQAVVTPTASLAGGRFPTRERALGPGDPLAGHAHQQGQFYGHFVGRTTLADGDRKLIAAPGSWTYHGRAWPGVRADGTRDHEGNQAAYWVPIRVTFDAGAAPPTHLRVTTDGGPANNPRAVRLHYFDPARPDQRAEVRPGALVPFRPGWVFEAEFLGGSATQLAVDGVRVPARR
jgi:hypothetical protein